MQITAPSKRQNQLLSLLIETSPLAILLSNSEGTIELVNQVAKSLFGYEESELVGKPLKALFPDFQSESYELPDECFLSHLCELDLQQGWSLLGRRKDNSSFSAKIKFHPTVAVDGDRLLASIINTGTDIATYESRIQGERLAAVLQVATGLAHESRNALQRAQSGLDLLELDLCERTDLLALTNRIRNAIQDIHQNYEEVKSYAAPIILKRSSVDLPELCQATFDELNSENYRNSVRTLKPPVLSILADANCGAVNLDRDLIRATLQHLLENAIHSSPSGGLIEFQCRFIKTSDHSNIDIRLRDFGPGLDATIQQRMFDPFFTTKCQGTGLGLSVCRRIIDAHGGSIEAANHQDSGAEIRIQIPVQSIDT